MISSTQETWDPLLLAAYLNLLQELKAFVVIGGGWAWHFLSPKGHIEYKNLHDHQELDILAPPRTIETAHTALQRSGFKATTLGPLDRQYRNQESFLLVVNFRVQDAPVVQCPGGWLVLPPDQLLARYGRQGLAARAASEFLASGKKPTELIGWQGLVNQP